jgi:hypothetical protein
VSPDSERRQAPSLAGDEVAVSRWSRRWRRIRAQVRVGFYVGVVGLAAVLSARGVTDFSQTAAVFGALSLAFMLVFLWAGARMAMRPVEVYDDGIVGTHLSFPVGRRRFVRWGEVRSVAMGQRPDGKMRLVVEYGRRGRLVSVPGEFSQKQFQEIEERRGAAQPERREQGAATKAVESAGQELAAAESVGVQTPGLRERLAEASQELGQRKYLEAAQRALSVRDEASAAARTLVERALASASFRLERDRAAGGNTDGAEAELSRARRLLREDRVNWQAAMDAVAKSGSTEESSTKRRHDDSKSPP